MNICDIYSGTLDLFTLDAARKESEETERGVCAKLDVRACVLVIVALRGPHKIVVTFYGEEFRGKV